MSVLRKNKHLKDLFRDTELQQYSPSTECVMEPKTEPYPKVVFCIQASEKFHNV